MVGKHVAICAGMSSMVWIPELILITVECRTGASNYGAGIKERINEFLLYNVIALKTQFF